MVSVEMVSLPACLLFLVVTLLEIIFPNHINVHETSAAWCLPYTTLRKKNIIDNLHVEETSGSILGKPVGPSRVSLRLKMSKRALSVPLPGGQAWVGCAL